MLYWVSIYCKPTFFKYLKPLYVTIAAEEENWKQAHYLEFRLLNKT